MNRELLSKAFGDIDDRFVAEAYRPVPEDTSGSSERITHMKKKRIITFAIAAALMLSLGMAAYAGGWFAPIFHSQLKLVPETDEYTSSTFTEDVDSYYAELEKRNELYESAEEYMNTVRPEAETVALPEFDNSSITLCERYYNGNTLLLGVNLDAVTPGMIVGYAPDEDLMGKINNIAFFHDVKGNDSIDALLEGGMSQELYDSYVTKRTDYAKEYDFRHLSSIEFDRFLETELTAEEYEAAWKMLRETGRLCVVQSIVYIGDHLRMEDGTDLGPTGQQNMDRSEPNPLSGTILIQASELPEAAQNLDRLDFQMHIKQVRVYYYMELGGPAYFYTELVGESTIPFSVENAES